MEKCCIKRKQIVNRYMLVSELSDYLILRSLLGLVSALLSTSSL